MTASHNTMRQKNDQRARYSPERLLGIFGLCQGDSEKRAHFFPDILVITCNRFLDRVYNPNLRHAEACIKRLLIRNNVAVHVRAWHILQIVLVETAREYWTPLAVVCSSSPREKSRHLQYNCLRPHNKSYKLHNRHNSLTQVKEVILDVSLIRGAFRS